MTRKKPCERMDATTLRQRLQSVRQRLVAALPGDPSRRMLRSWHSRYQRALDVLRNQA